jgi:hypothetical protein
MTFVPLQIASVTGARPAEIGLASGLMNAFVQIGGAIGLAALSTIATTEFNGVMAGADSVAAYPTALIAGFRHAFEAGAVLLGTGSVLVLLALPQGGRTAADAPEPIAIEPLEFVLGDDVA